MTLFIYSGTNFEGNIDTKQRILRCMRQAALATLILQSLASILSSPTTDLDKIVDTWPENVTRVILLLLTPPPNPIPTPYVPTGAPAAADLYLLQSVAPHQQLLKVLKCRNLLTKLKIPTWFVNESIHYV